MKKLAGIALGFFFCTVLCCGLVGAFVEEPKPDGKAVEQSAATSNDVVDAQAKEEAQRKLASEALDGFLEHIRSLDPDRALFESARVSDDQLILVVSNAWHIQPYQLRLQAAQNVWRVWAAKFSPTDADGAPMSIVDFNENEVGGRTVWSGVWVQER